MIAWSDVLIRLSLAGLFGALIGLERERKDWAAGMRTHMMVSVGSCLIMIVSAFGFSDILGAEHVSLDPSRVAAQVVSGIGFIGAGTILFLKQGAIRGLTTAAGLWTVAAIGLATGGGLYFAAAAATVIALIILWALDPLDKFLAGRLRHKTLKIITDQSPDFMGVLKTMMDEAGLEATAFKFDKVGDRYVFQLGFAEVDRAKVDEILCTLKNTHAIKEVIWSP